MVAMSFSTQKMISKLPQLTLKVERAVQGARLTSPLTDFSERLAPSQTAMVQMPVFPALVGLGVVQS